LRKYAQQVRVYALLECRARTYNGSVGVAEGVFLKEVLVKSILLNVAVILSIVCLNTSSSTADWLKVDISTTGQSRGWAPGWTQWIPPAINCGSSTSTTINGLTFTIAMTVPTGDSTHYLKCQYANKNGQIGNTPSYPMAYDGIWPHQKDSTYDMPYPNGGSMSLTISGLSEGPHNIVTYHNDPYAAGTTPAGWSVANNVSDCNVIVNGVSVDYTTPTTDIHNDAACGYAYFTVNAVAGTPVVINFVPAHNRSLDTVFLNAFEIDAPGEPSAMATTPVPADLDLHVNCNNDDPAPGHAADGYTTLSWTPSAFATCHAVYFGTNLATISSATTATPGVYFGTQTATTFARTGLTTKYTYYWRIDEINTAPATPVITKGAVWSFAPRRVAFPGAEGWGRFSRGGRGGRVLHVTNLNSSGPGSFKAAIDDTGPRTIVFDISGIIPLTGSLQLKNNDCTVAGQTAPGKGICFKDYDFGPYGGSDFIIRHVRVRVGKEIGTDKTLGGMGCASSTHAIFDHCSISWSIDEAFSSRSAGNITFQRSLISEALCVAGHNNYPFGDSHGFAASIGGVVGSFHHNLLAHCEGRNWSLAGGLTPSSTHTGSLDIRNNVVYNWDGRTTDGGAQMVNFVRNYYKPGPATEGPYTELNPQFQNPGFGPQQYYVEGNVMVGHHGPEGPLPPFAGMDPQGTQPWPVTVPTPFFENYVTTQSAADAYLNVLADVGCNRPMLDDHDTRVINETRNGTFTYRGYYTNRPGLIDNQADVGGWENYPVVTREANFDTDGDGMPDAWETAHSLNPNDASDGNADQDNDGYTNLESYLAAMAGNTTTADTTAPMPNPMTFASAPAGASSSTITMTATTAADDSGVQYFFHCLTTGGHDSGWQDSATYVDTGLTPSTSYSYQVKARDKSSNLNETGYSAEASGTTQVPVETIPPQPNPMTWATEPHALSYASISMTATTATDDSGVQYYFTCTAGGGHNSGWQDSPLYTDTGLSYNSTYTYTVKARDKSSNYNTTAESSAVSANTGLDDDAPLPNPMTWATTPYGINYSMIYMVATGAADISGVEYYFTCTSGGGHDSGWQSSTAYTDSGLSEGQVCTYTVQARDKSASQNTTAPSSAAAAATMNHAPTPAQMAFETVPHAASASSIAMTAVEANDISGVQYYFACTAGGGHDSGWQDDRSYTDTGLVNNATYSYRVIARDKSAQGKENAWSDEAIATTPLYVCTQSIASDINGNCQADFLDFAAVADAWSQTAPTVQRVVNGTFTNDIVPGWQQFDKASATGACFMWYDNAVGNPVGSAGIGNDSADDTTSGHYMLQVVPVTVGRQYTVSAEWMGDMSEAAVDPAHRTQWSRVLVFFEGSAEPSAWTSLGSPDSIMYGKSFGATSQNIGTTGMWDWEQITASPIHGPVDGVFTATARYMVVAFESGGAAGSGVGFCYLDNVSVSGPGCPQVDLSGDCSLDFADLCQLATDWLVCNREPASECWQ
jgi:hypothetical protein